MLLFSSEGEHQLVVIVQIKWLHLDKGAPITTPSSTCAMCMLNPGKFYLIVLKFDKFKCKKSLWLQCTAVEKTFWMTNCWIFTSWCTEVALAGSWIFEPSWWHFSDTSIQFDKIYFCNLGWGMTWIKAETGFRKSNGSVGTLFPDQVVSNVTMTSAKMTRILRRIWKQLFYPILERAQHSFFLHTPQSAQLKQTYRLWRWRQQWQFLLPRHHYHL